MITKGKDISLQQSICQWCMDLVAIMITVYDGGWWCSICVWVEKVSGLEEKISPGPVCLSSVSQEKRFCGKSYR